MTDTWWRRGSRDWLVDIAVFAFAVAAGIGVLFIVRTNDPSMSGGRFAFQICVAVVAGLLLWFRRRWPIPIALGVLALGLFFGSAVPAGMVMLFTLGVHASARISIGFAVTNVLASGAAQLIRPDPSTSLLEVMLWSASSTLVLVAWGMVVRARRQLVQSLRERAERAESEQRLRAEQARHAERSRIAREMHDVLAHRISLIALQAGGLEVRPDLPPGEVRESAQLIRSTARHALEELRDVIGVLRDDPTAVAEVPNAPQPALRDIPRLVEDGRKAGANVTLTMAVDNAEDAPGTLGRAAYRIVQEALTNVNKHARGTETTVAVTGGSGTGLRVTVRNRLPVGDRQGGPALPGSGRGLVGLAERVTLVGGTLSHGPTRDGAFEVDAKLEWSS